ncbi:MAG: pimelyl-acyl-carrier protein methyl ester esterase [Halothiobacillaceae bacterium]|nr:MAG: pimelyl-acyl-carrier protein methyl ester esterase [Halothiobacillaceae bacterium]
MAIALQHHHRMDKLILVSSTPRFITAEGWPHGVDAAIFQQFGYDLINNYSATLHRFLMLQSLGNGPARQRAHQLQQQLATYPQPSSTTLARGLRLLEEVDFRDDINQICAPTLMIHSNNDKLVPLSAAQFLHQQIPQSRLSLFESSGHIPFIHQPEQVATEINQFLYE